jgi:hypothetical protein
LLSTVPLVGTSVTSRGTFRFSKVESGESIVEADKGRGGEILRREGGLQRPDPECQ